MSKGSFNGIVLIMLVVLIVILAFLAGVCRAAADDGGGDDDDGWAESFILAWCLAGTLASLLSIPLYFLARSPRNEHH